MPQYIKGISMVKNNVGCARAEDGGGRCENMPPSTPFSQDLWHLILQSHKETP